MKAINQRAQKVMDILTQGLDKLGSHRTIDNSPGFMAVHVECIDITSWGPRFSIAHYFKQNGTLRDPEMCFLRGKDGEYYPTEFRQDGGLGSLQQESACIENGKLKFSPSLSAEHARFANVWMKNIKDQQGI